MDLIIRYFFGISLTFFYGKLFNGILKQYIIQNHNTIGVCIKIIENNIIWQPDIFRVLAAGVHNFRAVSETWSVPLPVPTVRVDAHQHRADSGLGVGDNNEHVRGNGVDADAGDVGDNKRHIRVRVRTTVRQDAADWVVPQEDSGGVPGGLPLHLCDGLLCTNFTNSSRTCVSSTWTWSASPRNWSWRPSDSCPVSPDRFSTSTTTSGSECTSKWVSSRCTAWLSVYSLVS